MQGEAADILGHNAGRGRRHFRPQCRARAQTFWATMQGEGTDLLGHNAGWGHRHFGPQCRV